MKTKFIFFIILAGVIGCSEKNYNPDQLSPQEKDKFMTSIIRYVAKLPENVSEEQKFDSSYNAHYQQKVSEARLEQYYRDGNTSYFLVSQIAPSLTVKRHATGGKVTFNDNGAIIDYEEVFRTWKMVPDTLVKRSYMLFDKMVKGEDLKRYETRYTNGVEFIEFPDDRTYYDKPTRKWALR